MPKAIFKLYRNFTCPWWWESRPRILKWLPKASITTHCVVTNTIDSSYKDLYVAHLANDRWILSYWIADIQWITTSIRKLVKENVESWLKKGAVLLFHSNGRCCFAFSADVVTSFRVIKPLSNQVSCHQRTYKKNNESANKSQTFDYTWNIKKKKLEGTGRKKVV